MELTSAPTGTNRAAMLAKRMPSFAGGTHAYRHSVDSALVSLAALGVAPQRIQLKRAGRQGASSGTVLSQKPAAGTLLAGDTLVELEIAGLGFCHALPVGMWDSGGEAAAGTREILEAFDDPLEKLKHWFHEGAPLFRIAPDDAAANARWLALFGVDALDWPRPVWFRLASLIARMGKLSCSLDGCAFVLDVLLGLPVQSFKRRPTETELPADVRSGLGHRSSQLGIDLLLGSQVEEIATLVIELGPVSLETFEQYAQGGPGASLLARTLRLVMPCSTPYEITWSVLDKGRAPRLGLAEHNARLGINTHMGGTFSGEPVALKLEDNDSADTPSNMETTDITSQLVEITKGTSS